MANCRSFYGTPETPIYAYPHNDGNICIIGGTYYGGDKIPDLQGAMIVGDMGSAQLWSLRRDETGALQRTTLTQVKSQFGRSLVAILGTPTGDVLVGTYQEIIPVNRPHSIDRTDQLPTKLSETGLFADLSTLTPAGVLPYDVNSPLWSDGAHKKRWVAVPGDGTDSNPSLDRIYFHRHDKWSFPTGTAFCEAF